MRLTAVSGVCAVLVLAACSPAGEAEAPATDSASATADAGSGASAASTAAPVTRASVQTAAAEGAEPFVRALYAQYSSGGPQGEPPAPGRDPLFSRAMNALIAADVQAANGEVPTLNYDPFCGCQDHGEFTIVVLAVAEAGPDAAEATVSFFNMGQPKNMKLKLVREAANWKVDDIVDGQTSLRDTLTKGTGAAG